MNQSKKIIIFNAKGSYHMSTNIFRYNNKNYFDGVVENYKLPNITNIKENGYF